MKHTRVEIEAFLNANKLSMIPAVAPAVPQSIMLPLVLSVLKLLALKSSYFSAALFLRLDAPSESPSFTLLAESCKSLPMVVLI